MSQRIAFQGNIGSYAHLMAKKAFPTGEAIPYPTFDKAMESTENGETDIALIPIENSTMGRIADLHHLMPHTSLHIVSEHYLPIQHCLMARPGLSLNDVKDVYSQIPALQQCWKTLKDMNLNPISTADTAGAAKMIAEEKTPHAAALASSLAAETYGLNILNNNMNDTNHNTTRFVAFSKEQCVPHIDTATKTSLLFTVKSIPAALYKSLGGFATNDINLTKLESYLLDGDFTAAQFYAEIETHINAPETKQAMEELTFFTENIKILGCYPLNPLS